MLMSDVRRECLKKGVSQLGTKDKMIDRLVEKEKPPGECAPHSSKPRANLSVVHEPQLLLAPPGAAVC